MAAKSRPIDRAIAALAATQHGVVALWQLVDLGLAAVTVRDRVAAGRLHRIHRGVYAVGHHRLTKRGSWMAAVLACGLGAVLSHTSGGALHGIANGRGLHVSSPTRSRHGIPGLSLHQPRGLSPHEVAEVDGIPVTTVTRTLVDLATILDYDQLKRAFQAAQRQQLLDVNALRPYLDQRRRGIAKLRALVEQATDAPDTKGEFEDRFADFLGESRHPEAGLNTLIAIPQGRSPVPQARSAVLQGRRPVPQAPQAPLPARSAARRLLRTAPSPTRAARANAA